MTDKQAIRFCAETFAAQRQIPHTHGGMVVYLEKLAETISKSSEPILIRAVKVHEQLKVLAALPPARNGRMERLQNG